MNATVTETLCLPTNLRVLFVDDGCGSLSKIHRLLSESGFCKFELNCVTTVVSAVNSFSTNAHDVCLIDSSERGSQNFLAQAKTVACEIPMIVLTSDCAREVLEAFHSGAADCLVRDRLTASLLEESICKVILEHRLVESRIENERRYAGLVQNARDVIYTHDLFGNYTSVNTAAEQLTGYTIDEILRLNSSQVVAPEYLDLCLQMVERKLDEQKETAYEVELVTKDGVRVPVEINTHLIYSAGKAVAVQGIARDVRQRKAFQSALEESEARYRELFENANDIIYVHDLAGNFLSLNHAGEILTGYSREEAFQMNVAQVVAPDHLEQAMRMIGHKTANDVPTTYELDVLAKCGRRVSLEVSTRTLMRDGAPVAIEGIGRDITERKRAELERRVMLEIIQSVTLTSNLDELLRMVHQALRKILYAENCFVALHDKDTGMFTRPFFVDQVAKPASPEKMKRGMTAYVFRTGEPVLLNHELFERLIEEDQVELVGHFSPSWLGVPLKTPSETIGVLVVQDYEHDNTYTQRDLEFLSSVGSQIALAIERKRAEAALKKSEAEYRDIFDNSTIGIYRSTREGKLVTANQALARILGYSSVAEVLGLDLANDVYFDSGARARLIEERAPSGSAQGLEVRWKKKDGSKIWVQLSVIAIPDKDGHSVLFDGFVNDITERKEAEQALRESEERYQRLVELSPDAIIVHTEGIISFVNGAGVRLIGAPDAKSIIGQSIFSFIDESQQQRFRERVARLQKGEFLPPVEVRGKRFDGTELQCEVLSVPFTTHDHPAVQVVIRDITGRKQVQEALEEANRRALADYERLVERIAVLGQSLGNARELKAILRAVRDFTTASVPCDGIVITLYDADRSSRRAVYCCVDGVEIDTGELSFPVGDGITGRAIKSSSIIIENDYQTYLQFTASTSIGDFTEGRVPQSALSAPMTIMGRTVGCIEIQSYLLNAYTEEHKTAMRMAASLAANAVENVTLMEREQEKADQLRQSQKMEAVGQLAGGVAHDFNNLLTAISGYSELGLRRISDNDPLRKNLDEIRKASSRASSLTRQLLAFSRKQMLQAKVFDLNTVVSEMDRMLRRLISEDIDFTTLLDPVPCHVKADPGQIEQVIINLAVNARDAMPTGGKLTIETRHVDLDKNFSRDHVTVQPGAYVMLVVNDTGEGMDAETQKRVFEPFFTTKEMGKGTGLGLSTVHGIVNQSGGTVWLNSELGKGSTFRIYLPAIIEKNEATETKSSAAELPRGNETVLLVEDEEMVRNLSREILQMNGYRVLSAANGEEACDVCERYGGQIDLVVTDVVMPLMSGREVVEKISQKRPEMRVLYMSGYTDDAIVRHGVLDAGVPFLQKPFTPDSLARKVRELIERAPVTSR